MRQRLNELALDGAIIALRIGIIAIAIVAIARWYIAHPKGRT